MYASLIADPAVLRSLNRIANNALPGFRPVTSGGEVRPSSSASERKRPNTPPVLERGGTRGAGRGGGAKLNGQGRVPPPLALNLLQPCSPESRQISELASEVAYLVGTSAGCKLPVTPSPPSRRKEATLLAKQPHERSTAKEPIETTARQKHATKGERADLGPASPTRHASTIEPGRHDARADEVQRSMVTRVTSGGRGVGVVTGRPGTYSGCGVTNCKGLGFSGEHGDMDGNTPHGAFVLREAENGGGGNESAPCKNKTRNASGVTPGSDGTGAKDETAPDEHDTGSPITASPDVVVVATPLALLSAREPSFRNELIRRKEHYSLGGTRKKWVINDDEIARDSLLDEPILGSDKRKAPSGPSVAVERGRTTKPLRRPWSSRQHSKGSAPAPVDVSESPLMASTRPTEVHPALDSRRIDPTRQREDNPQSLRGRCSRSGGKEFVTFARPAAHWSVTKSLSASPGRVRSKGVRVSNDTNDGGGGLVVGRFACRGYLHDPTFSDQNAVILHPRLPLIAGGGGGFSQVPEDSTLAELVAPPVGKVCPIGGGANKKLEPYRNVVDVLHHSVGVSGGRTAGKKI